jgi:hypothetical protein
MNNEIITADANTRIVLKSNDTLLNRTQQERKETSVSFPYIQNVNPKGSLLEISKKQIPYGIFIAESQAQTIKFNPDNNWEGVQLFFNEANPVEVFGYLTRRLRLVFLEVGQPVIQVKHEGIWKYHGDAFLKGAPTPAYESFKADQNNFRLRTKNLILLLDAENNIMSNGNSEQILPIQWSFSRGIGATLGNDIRWYYSEFDKLLQESLNQVGNFAYTQAVRNHFVLDIQLDLRKIGSGSNFLAPSKLWFPTLDPNQVGKFAEKIYAAKGTTTERKLALEYVPITNLLIDFESETGLMIDYLTAKYLKNRPTKQTETETQEDVYAEIVDDNIPF